MATEMIPLTLTISLLRARVAEGGKDLLLRAVLPEAGETRRGGAPLLQEVKTPTEGEGGN